MKITVELTYPDSAKNREVTFDTNFKSKGNALLNAIDRAVTKLYAEDKEWTGWDLRKIE